MSNEGTSIKMETSVEHENEKIEHREAVSVFLMETGKENSSNAFKSKSPSSHENNEPCDEKKKLFECDVCNMTFSNSANMRRHKLRHTGYKPYECKICKKRFFRKDHLVEHFTTHTKNFPYLCPVCNLGFRKQVPLKAHFYNEHVGTDKLKSCPLCGFKSKDLRLHLLNNHDLDLDNPNINPMNNVAFSIAPLMSGGELGVTTESDDDVLASGGFSDNCESIEDNSVDKDTPPMHFLTSFLEITMTPAQPQPKTKLNSLSTPSSFSNLINSGKTEDSNNVHSSSPDSLDSNSNNPNLSSRERSSKPPLLLMPIKQEPPELKKMNGSSSCVQKNNSKNLLKTLLKDDSNKSAGSHVSPSTTRSPSPESQSSSSLHCFFCNILFPDLTLYFLHKGCHSDSNPWRCNICGEQLLNVYEFNSHLLSKTHS